jgi:hypothetical protein
MWFEYNQIWLNLLRDDGQFFYIFLLMIATQATEKEIPKKKHLWAEVRLLTLLLFCQRDIII